MNGAPIDFMHAHSLPWLLLAGLAFFPRLTLLFIGGPFGVLHWLGWLFAPHLLVAILATTMYWHTNPYLCVIAWFLAFAGTSGEGKAVRAGSRRWRKRAAPGVAI